ncbi:squalene/phytoene synthase family protein [Hephaestia sp. GCM10023244]|uniref:squalene/phytoene synthase family protein n=1 Tax=unclassified Hephaestia TaxID=2631281 RepID=UPI0020777109|nr:squalene/phytoene synthase family protein [Hephaestia sp. MAHUQ-44]MCM8730013.1 squalene/phytoene synthase family protein [Hephaestia sp. MAHUQ-44]
MKRQPRLMTTPDPGPISDPEQALAITYALRPHRAALTALFALDATLADVLRTTSEPMLGQMRLTWWYDALTRLDSAPPPAEPVLSALAATVLCEGVSGADLAELVAGWEELLEPDLDEAGLVRYAAERGGRLFTLTATISGVDRPAIAPAGEGWALADLAFHVSDPALIERARALAQVRLDGAAEADWPRAVRTLGALVHLARLDLATPVGERPAKGAPRRVARLLWHRLTGR